MRRNALIVLACIVGVGVNCFLVFPALPQVIGGDNDFMGFYAASHLSGSDLYDHKAIVAIEKEVWNTPRNLPFARFPFYAVMVSPLRYFSYQHAYWVLAICFSAVDCLILCFLAVAQEMGGRGCLLLESALAAVLHYGQDVTFILLVFGISIALFSGGWRFAAGCVFSLCCIKYNLFMALPPLILARRLWSLELALPLAAPHCWQYPLPLAGDTGRGNMRQCYRQLLASMQECRIFMECSPSCRHPFWRSR